MKRVRFIVSSLLSLLFLLPHVVLASDTDITTVPAPEGIMGIVSVLPIIIILVLLFLKVDMLVAGLIGGVLSMIIGGITLGRANELFL